MRRGVGAATAALAAAALVAVSVSAARHGAAAPGAAPASAPVPPVVVRDCWVPASTGNVSLSGDQARSLTTRAAQLGRGYDGGGRVARRLAVAVRDTVSVAPGVAAEVAAGLAGVRGAPRLVCAYARTRVDPQRPGPSGLVPRAVALRAAWTAVFGDLTAGGFAPGGVTYGHTEGSAHYEGRAVDVFFRPLADVEQHRRGWVFAQWLVAHAPEHDVLSVIYDDHIWTSWAPWAWRDYVAPGHTSADRGDDVLRHREHVHVAVEDGRPYEWP